jgi:hypothetical protein
MVQVDANGIGNYAIDRTPTSGFTANDNILWSFDTLYDSAAGSEKTLVLALPASLLNDQDDQTERSLFVGDVVGTGVFTDVTDANAVASGGVFTTPPYAVLYGNNGKVTWSNANEPQNYTTGDAGTARVTGAKIIKGASLRSGSGAAGLMWSLDSVIRMDWIGGSQVFKFSTLSRNSSIMSANSVVEYDGAYYWIGRDRFLVCNGSQVDEVPNDMNLNWFFDGINKTQRGKVWGMKIPRYGEIWWFYPRGDATECTHAVILNVREKSWYDVELARTAGYHQVAFDYPVLAGQEPDSRRFLSVTTATGTFTAGDVIIGADSAATGEIILVDGTDVYVELSGETEFIAEAITTPSQNAVLSGVSGTIGNGDTVLGATSGAVGIISLVTGTTYHIIVSSGVFEAEVIDNQSQTGSATIDSVAACTGSITVVDELYSLFTHERGWDAVGDSVSAIKSWFTTSDIGLPTGGVPQSPGQGLNRWSRLVRIEPDILQEGDMTLEVIGNEFANSPDVISDSFTFDADTVKIDTRIQQRHLRLKFTSNTSGGKYELGKVLLHIEPGDIRS